MCVRACVWTKELVKHSWLWRNRILFAKFFWFSSFLDKLLKHYQALFESLEQSFPVHLANARTAMESFSSTLYEFHPLVSRLGEIDGKF